MNKISFIIEFDEVSKTQEEQLTEFIEKTGIKFHVLENDNDLKKYEKYKEVIDKLKNKTKENIENAKCEITTLTIGDKAYYQYIEKILDNYVDILKEVE